MLAMCFFTLLGVFRLNQEEMISKGNQDLFFTYVTDIAQVSQDAQVAHVNIILSVNLVKSLFYQIEKSHFTHEARIASESAWQ